MLSSRCRSQHALHSTSLQQLDARFYKTKICSFYTAGTCKRGARCTFAHSEEHVAAQPDLRGTRPCRAFGTKHGCKKGDACAFAHLADRRRQPVTPASSAPGELSKALKAWAQREEVALGQGQGCLSIGLLSLRGQSTDATTRDYVSFCSSSSLSSCPEPRENSEEDQEDPDVVSQDEVHEGCLSQSIGITGSPRNSWAERADDSADEADSVLLSFAGKSLEADSGSYGVSSTATSQVYIAQPSSKRSWADLAEDSDDEGPWSTWRTEDRDVQVCCDD
mmetsp:Transcript_11000/g.24595  ORF Transcript_11000/g.24595 Transcript_11000/m.24595 type:complete len:278 (-) Transcript_11000:391-1224(-)